MKKILCMIIASALFSMPCLAIEDSNLDVVQSQQVLSTQLKKYYSGYNYTITNNSNESINIVNAQIVNGNDGNIGYNTTMNNEPSAMGRTWAIAGPVGLFTLGIGWIAGLVATPIVAIVSGKNKRKTQTESFAYSNIVPVGVLNSGESISVNTLVPLGSKPQLKITIQDKNKDLKVITR